MEVYSGIYKLGLYSMVKLFGEIYQILFFASLLFLIRLLFVFIAKFQAFRKAMSNNDEELAKRVLFTLNAQEVQMMLVAVGIILAFLI
jgi:uncharacterized membrane protein